MHASAATIDVYSGLFDDELDAVGEDVLDDVAAKVRVPLVRGGGGRSVGETSERPSSTASWCPRQDSNLRRRV